jgi:hypothetical protein
LRWDRVFLVAHMASPSNSSYLVGGFKYFWLFNHAKGMIGWDFSYVWQLKPPPLPGSSSDYFGLSKWPFQRFRMTSKRGVTTKEIALNGLGNHDCLLLFTILMCVKQCHVYHPWQGMFLHTTYKIVLPPLYLLSGLSPVSEMITMHLCPASLAGDPPHNLLGFVRAEKQPTARSHGGFTFRGFCSMIFFPDISIFLVRLGSWSRMLFHELPMMAYYI